MTPTIRFTYAGGRAAYLLGPGRYRVFGLDGVTVERRGIAWFVCAGGERLLGAYTTMREALAAIPGPIEATSTGQRR